MHKKALAIVRAFSFEKFRELSKKVGAIHIYLSEILTDCASVYYSEYPLELAPKPS